jgi:transcriptional regulator with GAF, ATPase, and Fis domain
MTQNQSTLPSSGVTEPQDGSHAERVPGLVCLFSAGAPCLRVLPLRNQELELGRSHEALAALQDRRMSRRHTLVRLSERRFWATDLTSQNGTCVDGERISPEAPREVERVLRVGDSLFVPTQDVRPLERPGVRMVDGHVRGPALQMLLSEVERVARLGSSLYIHGESGSGKEGVARAFHQGGPRRAGPFVPVNCATIPQAVAERLLFGTRRGAYSGADADADGYLQAADGGTLFLDEVVELELAVQAKLLRVLETGEILPLGAVRPKKVHLQLCFASNKDLRSLVANGRIREDLYFRISRPGVSLLPLRERPEEIPPLIQLELQRAASQLELHFSFIEACLLRPWPGNVRELLLSTRSAIQMALVQGAQRLEARHLSPTAGTAFGSSEDRQLPPQEAASHSEPHSRAKPLDVGERSHIEEALRQNFGNVAAAARALGMHRTQLRRLIERGMVTVPTSS